MDHPVDEQKKKEKNKNQSHDDKFCSCEVCTTIFALLRHLKYRRAYTTKLNL